MSTEQWAVMWHDASGPVCSIFESHEEALAFIRDDPRVNYEQAILGRVVPIEKAGGGVKIPKQYDTFRKL